MRKIRTITTVCLLTGLALSGCGRQSQITYESTRLEAMAEDLQENAQADSFAKELCVVTGTEGRSGGRFWGGHKRGDFPEKSF